MVGVGLRLEYFLNIDIDRQLGLLTVSLLQAGFSGPS